MEAGNQFGFRLRKIKGRSFVRRQAGDKVDEKGQESKRVSIDQPGVDSAALEVAEADHVERARRHNADDDGDSEWDFVGDHLARLAHRAVDGPFVIARPAGEDDSHHLDAEDRENPEDADVEPRLKGKVRPERQREKGGKRRRERKIGSEAKKKTIGVSRDEIFLEDELHTVRDGLKYANWP